MENLLFSPMEIDALGEMMNISLGSSATAVSNLLERKVEITTPHVKTMKTADFVLGEINPAMGVEIKYVEGLSGSNMLLLKLKDIKVIVDILMGSETPDEEFEMNELTVSAVCEVMNQMMGAAATAMSDFFGFQVDISPPHPFELGDLESFKKEHFPEGAEEVIVVSFALKIENAIESGFMNVMSVELAKDLLKGLNIDPGAAVETEPAQPAAQPEPAPAPAPAPEPESAPAPAAASAPMIGGDSNRKMSQEEIEALLAGIASGEVDLPPAPEPEPAPTPAPAAGGGSGGKMSQEEIENMMASMAGSGAAPAPAAAAQPAAPAAGMPQMPPQAMPQMPMPGFPGNELYQMLAVQTQALQELLGQIRANPAPAPAPAEPKVINTRSVPMRDLDPMDVLGKEQAQNLDLIMEVPLQVTVEIGRTHRKVQDILEFSKGSLVVLDKLAGDQVDLFVNGKCVAKGDVVVIDDNFGVRITEIVQSPMIELVKDQQ